MDALLAGLKPLFAPAFVLWGSGVTWLEAVAFALALATVLLNIRVNPLGWPLAIVSSLLYFGLFWNSRLYGDAGLQILFAVVALWGWWQWVLGTQAGDRPLPEDLDRHRRAVVGCVPDRSQRRRPMAARPQVHRELADLAHRQRR